VVEVKVTAVTGLAGTARYLLICSRCYTALSERSPRTKKPAQEKSTPAQLAGKHWWNRLRRNRSKEEAGQMEPAQAVKEVERFLQQQRRQGVDHFKETD
jgi:hypothetical protein